eukprot:TRINITY_DN3153_c0_g3_i2.p1 TRINITY_DN3153_c0_g3~~TRINITY_DN3153_c0_g3_i2.p1  ORF type:complete len:639 (-),score=190.96 TRINITY_DN3153_c0_g3_i2:114-2030(-)
MEQDRDSKRQKTERDELNRPINSDIPENQPRRHSSHCTIAPPQSFSHHFNNQDISLASGKPPQHWRNSNFSSHHPLKRNFDELFSKSEGNFSLELSSDSSNESNAENSENHRNLGENQPVQNTSLFHYDEHSKFRGKSAKKLIGLHVGDVSPLSFNSQYNSTPGFFSLAFQGISKESEEEKRYQSINSFISNKRPKIMQKLGEIMSILKQNPEGGEKIDGEGSVWCPLLDDVDQFYSKIESISQFSRFLMKKETSVVNSVNNGYFCVLPDEIIYHIFSYLEMKDMYICATVNRDWNRLASDDTIYKLICEKKGYSLRKPVHKSWKWMALVQCKIFPTSPVAKSGCGTFVFPENKGQYVGEWEKDLRHGFGVQQWTDKSQYIGEWFTDNKHGQGTMTWADGQCYTGEWKNNRKEGKGVEVWADGRKYIGEYKNSNMDGHGTYTWPGGDHYEGQWRDDNMHGFGTYTWPNGSVYSGDWANDEHNGHGEYKCGEETYEGEWRNNLRHGTGREMWGNGMKYEGGWKDNKKDGDGLFIWKDCDYYKGKWENGRRIGSGAFVSNRNVFYQMWKDSDLVDESDKGLSRAIQVGKVDEFGEFNELDVEKVVNRKNEMDRTNEEESMRDRKKTKPVEPFSHKSSRDL